MSIPTGGSGLSTGQRWIRGVSGAAAAAVLVATAMAGLATAKLNSNITVVQGPAASTRPDKAPPPTADGEATAPTYEPLNILVMGSDTREGQGAKFGDADELTGARSDTTMIVHLNAARDRALVVSIPRDTWTVLPGCADYNNDDEPREGLFNEAFEFGGPACTVELVEDITNVRMDHFIVLNFLGFENVIDTIGGVNVCLKEPVHDKRSKLDLPAGNSLVTGDQAIAFVRTRYGIGDGSDLGRIDRQQAFMSSLIRKVTDVGTFLNPGTLTSTMNTITESLTTDEELGNVKALGALASSVVNLKPAQISFVTVPWIPRGDDSNILIAENAQTLWDALRQDTTWPAKPVTGTDGKALTVEPSDISVRVLDGSGQPDLAARAVEDLEARGYTVADTDVAASGDYASSQILFDPDRSDSARTLDAALGDVTTIETDGLGRTLTLIIGADYSGVSAVKVASGGGFDASNPTPKSADTNVCS